MKYYFLASGSKGNCFVLRDEDAFLIIDCGTTRKYLRSCFQTIGMDYGRADALLITHTHTDHISQIKMFGGLPIYSANPIKDCEVIMIRPFKSFMIKHLKVTVLPLSHDSPNTVGFVIESAHEKLVYVTDTGYIREDVQGLLADADYIVLESNHDVEMLMKTSRPYVLKTRILSDSGHLSNESCGRLLNKLICAKTKEVILAHISEEANTAECAVKTVTAMCKGNRYFKTVRLRAALQHEILTGGVEHDEKSSDCGAGAAARMEYLVDA